SPLILNSVCQFFASGSPCLALSCFSASSNALPSTPVVGLCIAVHPPAVQRAMCSVGGKGSLSISAPPIGLYLRSFSSAFRALPRCRFPTKGAPYIRLTAGCRPVGGLRSPESYRGGPTGHGGH